MSFNSRPCSSRPVTQLQMTLASVQELLVQQQQKVQELAHELATAKVRTPAPGPRVAPGASHGLAPRLLCPWRVT